MLALWLALWLFAITSSLNSYGVEGSKKHEIERPCDVTDWDCIRNYFTGNFDCTAIEDSESDEGSTEYPITHANASFTFFNDSIEQGLIDGKIIEFYTNKASGNVVVEVEFEELYFNDCSATVRVYRIGKEPVDLTGCVYLGGKKVSLTLVFPLENGLVITQSIVYTYLIDRNVNAVLGPAISSKDPTVHASLQRIVKKALTTLQDFFETAGPQYLSVFFNNNICELHNKVELREALYNPNTGK